MRLLLLSVAVFLVVVVVVVVVFYAMPEPDGLRHCTGAMCDMVRELKYGK